MIELQQQETLVCQATPCGGDKAAVMRETVTGGEDGVERLAGELSVIGRGCSRQVGQVGDDDIEPAGDGREKVASPNMNAFAEAVPMYVGAGERDRALADVGRPNLGAGAGDCDGDRDRSAAGTHVDDARRSPADAPTNGGD